MDGEREGERDRKAKRYTTFNLLKMSKVKRCNFSDIYSKLPYCQRECT